MRSFLIGLTALSLFLCFVPGAIGATGDVEMSLAAPGSCPTDLAFDGRLLWAADRRTDRIYGIEPESGVTEKVLESPGYWPTGLAFDGEQLWVADREQKLAFRIDPASGITTRTVELDADAPEGLAWDGTHLWCIDGRQDLILRIDPSDGTNVRSFAAPSSNPTGLAFDGAYLWVADRVDDAIYRIDTKKGTALVKLASPGRYPYGLAWAKGKLWCADYQEDRLDRITLEGEERFLSTGERRARLAYVMELVNFGPGPVETADFYAAIPGDGDNQRLLSEVRFEPDPLEIVEDRWGQPFAHFCFEKIEASGSVEVVMHCDALLKEVSYLLFPEKVGSFDEIPPEISGRYLADGAKYDLSDPFIAQSAEKAAGGEENVLEAVLKIYDFVMEKMRYELVGGWNAAPTVLQRGTGSCSEYTFSFIALCRAAGIPARYAGSLVIRGDGACYDDVFHRWAEVYLPRLGWVPFDPSRGDKEKPADRLKGMGWLDDSLLITTRGGGDSEFLGWTYNGDIRWTARGRCKVRVEQIAEWEPLEKDEH